MHRFRSRTVAFLVPWLIATSVDGQTPATSSARPTSMAGRSVLYAPHAVAATSQPLATEAALSVMQHGGNAIDAAVTAAAVLSVVEPMMTGVGGDLFAIICAAREKRLV